MKKEKEKEKCRRKTRHQPRKKIAFTMLTKLFALRNLCVI